MKQYASDMQGKRKEQSGL